MGMLVEDLVWVKGLSPVGKLTNLCRSSASIYFGAVLWVLGVYYQ